MALEPVDDSATTGEWEANVWKDEKTVSDPDTPVEQQFLLQLRDNPNDLAMRMVFADWLEEHAQPEKAEVVRLLTEQPAEGTPAMQRLRVVSASLGHQWMAVVSRATIARCATPSTFKLRCPKSWESLTSTENPTVRACSACQQHVYFCSTLTQVRVHADAQHCVAFSAHLLRAEADEEYDREVNDAPPELMMGMVGDI